ncbi:hypothetical protein [Almyronema epifaneia]|uniref:DUF2157 domain-containing protein n=1 Tax=Almyronema epifaneia S1 TaxID=2991925 RepID=A0ABW6IKQ1_9CYAN
MSSKQFIRIEVATDQPALLEGLEAWLQLALISDEQVRALGRTSFSCQLPTLKTQPPAILSARRPVAEAQPRRSPAAVNLAALSATSLLQPIHQLAERLMAELSVVWLLCLGVLLVVLSSAVLAATQWSQFNVIGQYLVLLAYTIIFWLGGRWAASQPRLQLTAKTLRIVALLLVPINLWAIDALQVGRSPLGLLVSLLAAGILTVCTIWRYPLLPETVGTLARPSRLVRAGSFLGLAYLQLGWNSLAVPLGAIYCGTAITAIAFLWPFRRQDAEKLTAMLAAAASLLVIYSLGVLLLRGLGTPDIDVEQLGLSIGICGALLVWLVVSATSHPVLGGLWLWSGRGLLWLGWFLSVFSLPLQAAMISGLGLKLRTQQLVKTGQSLHLIAALAIGLQLIWLGWRSLPVPWQQLATAIAAGWTGTETNPEVLLGIAYLPYLVLMVGLADWFYRRGQTRLAQLTEKLALGLGLLLVAISSLDLTVLALSLIVSTITLLGVTLRRSPSPHFLINITHALALLALTIAIVDRWPNLPTGAWLLLSLGVTWLEWGLCVGDRASRWRQSAWYFGCALAGLSYFNLLTALQSNLLSNAWSVAGLALPLGLTLLAWREPNRRYSYELSLLALGLTVPLTLFLPQTRLVGLGMATGLGAFLSRFWPRQAVTLLTVLWGLGWGTSLIQDLMPAMPQLTGVQWYPIGAIALLGLWQVSPFLGRRWPNSAAHQPAGATAQLPRLYGQATDFWGDVLCFGLLLSLSLEVGFLYLDGRSLQISYLAAMGIVAGAVLWRQWQTPKNSGVYLLGWAAELIMAEALLGRGGDLLILSAATVGLGLISLAIVTGRPPQAQLPLRSLQTLSLLYGLLALALRSGDFTATTGGITLGVSLMVLEVGRRWQSRWLGWLALIGCSTAWYELVLYQLSQAEGGDPGDGLVILAGVAVVIMGVYRLCGQWIMQRLHYPQLRLGVAAHLHWAIASLLLFLTLPSVWMTRLTLTPLALCLAIAVTLYPIGQSRSQQSESWLYVGLGQALGLVAYTRLLFPPLGVIDAWAGAIAVVLAVGLYTLPWSRWGWLLKPWQQAAIVLPSLVAVGGSLSLTLVNFWLAAGFYGWLSWRRQQIRLSYLSLGLIDWAIARWLFEQNIGEGFYYVLLGGGSLLYIAQVDPHWQSSNHKTQRHRLRVLGLGIILLYGLLFEPWSGLPVAAFSLVALLLGLGWRIRAFLYVGTVAFGVNAFEQLVILNAEYPLVKWMLGVVAGMALIWIAADFERRREQWLNLAQDWRSTLADWD